MRSIGFLSPDFRRDPWPVYAQMRARGGVWWSSEIEMWCVFRYAEVKTCLTSRCFEVRYPFRTSRDAFGETLLDLDGPDHERLRPILMELLKGRGGHPGFRTVARQEVGEQISALAERASIDFVADVAMPLPQRVTTRFLGTPAEQTSWLASRVLYLTEHLDNSQGDFERVSAYRREVLAYVGEQLDEARGRATPLGTLNVHLAAGRLSRAEAIGLVSLILAAGIETSVASASNAMWCLLAHPRWVPLMRDPESRRAFVREAVRWEPAQHDTVRFACEDVQLGGHLIERGRPLKLLLASANRDEAVFERGEQFEPDRERRPLLSFGVGPHACLGQQLALSQISMLIAAMVEAFPALRAVAQPQPPIEGSTFRRPATLPVQLLEGGLHAVG